MIRGTLTSGSRRCWGYEGERGDTSVTAAVDEDHREPSSSLPPAWEVQAPWGWAFPHHLLHT